MKIKEVDISNDDRPKIAKIGDYWTEAQTTEIVNLLKDFQDVFVADYKDLKGLVHEMGEMKIDINPDVRPVKKRPYKLAHKYKEIVKKEIDNMLQQELSTLLTNQNGQVQWWFNQRNMIQPR